MCRSSINQNANGLLNNLTFKSNHRFLISYFLIFQKYIDTWHHSSHVFHFDCSFYILKTPWIFSIIWTNPKLVVSSTSPTLEWFIWPLFYRYYKSIWTTHLLTLLSHFKVALSIWLPELFLPRF